jgi:hypothetical protein
VIFTKEWDETEKNRYSPTHKQHNLSVEEAYNKKELSMKLVVKNRNAEVYRVFHLREEFSDLTVA